LTAERLRELYHYEIVTGRFYRNKDGKEVKGWYGGKKKNYPTLTINQGGHRVHRLAYLWVEGRWPDSDVDHINGVTDCNAWHNLREATKSQNMWNTGLRTTNKSGVKGVCRCPDSSKWRAYLTINYKQHIVGRFDTVEEASLALRVAREALHGEFAHH
jgi:hypothetical protein